MGNRKLFPTIGTKYGKWTVISDKIWDNGSIKGRNVYFDVQCECGLKVRRSAYSLVHKTSKSCKSCSKTFFGENAIISSYLNKVQQRAHIKNIECTISVTYLEQILLQQNKKCALSGLDLIILPNGKKLNTASIDRIDSSKGYVQGNIQWVHKDINFMKGSLTEKQFINYCKLIIQNVDK